MVHKSDNACPFLQIYNKQTTVDYLVIVLFNTSFNRRELNDFITQNIKPKIFFFDKIILDEWDHSWLRWLGHVFREKSTITCYRWCTP